MKHDSFTRLLGLTVGNGEDAVPLLTRDDGKAAAEYRDRIVCNAFDGHVSRDEYVRANAKGDRSAYLELAFMDGKAHERREWLDRLAAANGDLSAAIYEMLPADDAQIGTIKDRQALAAAIVQRITDAIAPKTEIAIHS